MGTCLYFTCGFHVVDNVHLLYTVENKLNDVQIANPFDQRRWVESESDGEGEADTEEQQIIVLDVDQNDEAHPLLNNNTTRGDLNSNTRRDDLEPHTPKQYSLNDWKKWRNTDCECHIYKSSPVATNVAIGMQQLATIRDIQQHTQGIDTKVWTRSLQWTICWTKKAERIQVCCVGTVPDCFVQHVQYIHLQIMGSRLESSHGMDCSGIRAWERAIGSKCSKMKKEERGKRNELELEQDVQMCNVLRHFSAWTTGLCSLDELTKVHTPTCRRTAMNMKRRTRVGQPVSLHNTTSTGVRHSRSKMNSQSSTKEIEFTQ